MDGKSIIKEYVDWIKMNSFTRQVDDGNYCVITTPFLDRHNDHIDIYVSKNTEGGYLLTDDGETIADLESTGVFINTQKRRQILDLTLKGFGVDTDGDDLYVIAKDNNELPKKKQALIQAILSVNDMYMMSQENVSSFFKEDVFNFLNAQQASFVPNVKVTGKTGYDHVIDFILPRSNRNPERLIKVIDKVTRNQVSSTIFAHIDVSSAGTREGSKWIVMYNNEHANLSDEAEKAFKQYGIGYVSWEERVELLANENQSR